MDISEIINQRHSVRQYTDRVIEEDKRIILSDMIDKINKEENLHIQIFYDEEECFDSFMAHYGKFEGVKNYIALVGPKSEKLDEKLGYFGEKLVLKAQELGLNTCWVALTHGKSKAIVNKSEKEVCILSLGYGAVCGAKHKNKPLNEICNYSDDMPQWFKEGINAVLAAPTAMNQQKFFFELLPSGEVKAKCGKGFYTKLDLGIAIYHFEVVSGKSVIC